MAKTFMLPVTRWQSATLSAAIGEALDQARAQARMTLLFFFCCFDMQSETEVAP